MSEERENTPSEEVWPLEITRRGLLGLGLAGLVTAAGATSIDPLRFGG